MTHFETYQVLNRILNPCGETVKPSSAFSFVCILTLCLLGATGCINSELIGSGNKTESQSAVREPAQPKLETCGDSQSVVPCELLCELPIVDAKDEAIFYQPGEHLWTAPIGVSQVSVVVVGGGGGGAAGNNFGAFGGAGGGLAWANSISVVPGEKILVVVGAGGAAGLASESGSLRAGGHGGSSTFSSVLEAQGGEGASEGNCQSSSCHHRQAKGGCYQAVDLPDSGGGCGGDGFNLPALFNPNGGSGAGAGGYEGPGGSGSSGTAGNDGRGGAGGSGSYLSNSGGGGGGVGLYGIYLNGRAGMTSQSHLDSALGECGSSTRLQNIKVKPTFGRIPGGGGGGGDSDVLLSLLKYLQTAGDGGRGGSGAVRIIWGADRSFPRHAE